MVHSTVNMLRILIFPSILVIGLIATDTASERSTSSPLSEDACGLPDNFLTLPMYAQKELEAIWSNYSIGKCDKERKLAAEILAIVEQYGDDFEGTPVEASTLPSDTNGLKRNAAAATEFPFKAFPSTSSEYALADGFDLTTTTQRSGTNPPTQGKVAKSNWEAEYFGEEEAKALHETQNGPEQIRHPKNIRDRELDYDNADVESPDTVDAYDDALVTQFDTPDAPFLKDAAPRVKQEFMQTWSDPNIPSEGLRTYKIQLLAVSLLTGKQLQKYNEWATNRRKVLKAREQELSVLSPEALAVLRELSKGNEVASNVKINTQVKKELMNFIDSHSKRVRAARARKSARIA